MTIASEPTSADTLRAVAAGLEAVALDAELVAADRTYLTATAVRLRALAGTLDAPPEPEPVTAPPARPHRPEPTVTRREAARRARCAPNTLLNLEERGLLTPGRDERGWRVYTRADIDRARALLWRRVPVLEAE